MIIDQFLAAARAKCSKSRRSSSSCRTAMKDRDPSIPRRVWSASQLFAEGNLLVANPTTAAQYFHLLRRQAKSLASDRRPLVVMTPRACCATRWRRRPSTSSPRVSSRRFWMIRGAPTPESVTRLVLCSGKLAVELDSAPQREEAADVAIARVERLAPFPDEVSPRRLDATRISEIVWAQEEPRNMGAWTYVEPRLRELLQGQGKEIASSAAAAALRGRPERASPAEDRLTGTESSKRASSRPRWWRPVGCGGGKRPWPR